MKNFRELIRFITLSGYSDALRFKVENLSSFAVVVMCVAIIIYFVLRAILYNPIYVNDYLPLLNHVVEKLSGAYLKELDGVKKGQYSAVAIVLIQAVTNKLAGFPKPTGSKITKDQLAKLYGVSNWKSGPRIDREIADAFGEAKEYFSAIGSEQAVKLLDSIKLDVLVKRLPPTY